MSTPQSTSYEQLERENQKLREKVTALEKHESEVQKLREKIAKLEEQIAWFTKQIFGQRSERVVGDADSYQMTFGFEKPVSSQEEKEEKEEQPESRTCRKPKRNGQDALTIPSDLPVKTITLDIPEEEKVCKETGEALTQIGNEVSHRLAHKPGSYYIKKIIRPKYALPKREEAGVKTADLPETLLPRCKADESLLAEIMTKKFADHTPLYRLQESLKREGIDLSRKLLSQWVLRTGEALKPLYQEMLKQVLASGNIYIDESPVKLQGQGKCRQAYMWVIAGGRTKDPPYRTYIFKKNRGHDHVFDILKDYHGGLHSDKYAAYQKLAERKRITWYPCYSHIRRKFIEAQSGDTVFRDWVIEKIRDLFLLEEEAWTLSAEQRLEIRQKQEVPIIDELIKNTKAKLYEGKALPKSKFREALGYFCGLIPYLKNYTQDPFARMDNNVAERAVRPLAIGRKNWIFFGSEKGGDAGAVLLSLVQTCRGLGVNPREYLEDVMKRIMGHNSQKLCELLPDQWLEARRKNSSE